ncbi:hypothetical protein C4J81_15045 [Deltaproteobacteria bacterium Smac51]|nr:hypothetical protein C4J81_15045 [Deltaproteobacteria bacterium Smac51]
MPAYLKRIIAKSAVLLTICIGFWFGEAGGIIGESSAETAKLSEISPAEHNEGVKAYTGKRITLDFKDISVQEALEFIAAASDKKLIISDKVDRSQKLTLKLKDVPWEQALDIIMTARGLEVEISGSGDTLTIYKSRSIKSKDICGLHPPSPYSYCQQPLLSKKVFTPKHSSVGLIFAELVKMKGRYGKVAVIGYDIYVSDESEVMELMTARFISLERAAED